MNLLPALLIGGPPHSGKSVLSYSLSQALRARNIAHYLMRVAPDGEGDWSQEMDQRHVHDVRFKGTWTTRWVNMVCRDLAARPLPMLVDVGGQPTSQQLTIFDQCTGAIVLAPSEADAHYWRELVAARGLPIIADLRSRLDGHDTHDPTDDGIIRGVLTHLHYGTTVNSPTFDALARRVVAMFSFAPEQLLHAHLAAAPADATLVNMVSLAQRMYPSDPQHHFGRDDLQLILDAVPKHTPIAVYGRMPSWLATALGTERDIAAQFDVRLGWVRPPTFRMAKRGNALASINRWLGFATTRLSDGTVQLSVTKREDYLDYGALNEMVVPYLAQRTQLSISGPLPLWVFAAFGRAYRHLAHVTADQPQHASLLIKKAKAE